MALIEYCLITYLRFEVCDVFISALELSSFIAKMPSDAETDLAKTLSDLKEEPRDGFASLKRELSEEHDSAIKKLKSAASSLPKFKKKGNEKQFEGNSQILDHVQSASSFL